MHHVHCNPLNPANPLQFTLLRVPFFLEPDYDRSSQFEESNHDRLIRKWGGVAEFNAQKQRHGLKERGVAVGIPYFNLQRTASSTYLSHRMVQYVTHQHGVTASEALYSTLNYNHFVLGLKLNDLTMLLDAAAGALDALEGTTFDRNAAELYLSNAKNGARPLENARKHLHRLGIHSIPAFIVGGECMVGGAANSETFVEIFRKIERESPVKGMSNSMFGSTLEFSQQVLTDVLAFDCGGG